MLEQWTRLGGGIFMLARGPQHNRIIGWLAGERGKWDWRITRESQQLSYGVCLATQRDTMLHVQTEMKKYLAPLIACNLPFERLPQHHADPGYGPVPPIPHITPIRQNAKN